MCFKMFGESVKLAVIDLHHIGEGITEDVSHLEHQVNIHKIGPYEVFQIGWIIGILSGQSQQFNEVSIEAPLLIGANHLHHGLRVPESFEQFQGIDPHFIVIANIFGAYPTSFDQFIGFPQFHSLAIDLTMVQNKTTADVAALCRVGHHVDMVRIEITHSRDRMD